MTTASVKAVIVDKPFELRPYQSGDELGILALFEKVFRAPRALEHWQWQFEKNPYGAPQAVLAWDPRSNRVIGQYTVMPVGLNVMGRRLKAAQSLDTMVHSDYRRFGIFEAAATRCFDQLEAEGYALVYGFPNRNSYPGFLRKLNWSRVAFLKSYRRRLSLPARLQEALPVPALRPVADSLARGWMRAGLSARAAVARALTRPLVYGSGESLPESYDELWNAARSYEVLSLWKDSTYFKWRYGEKPAHLYRYHYLERDGVLEAMCVGRLAEEENSYEVLELIARDRSVRHARRLILETALEAGRQGARQIHFAGATLDFFDEVFRDFERETDFSMVFCLKTLGGHAPPPGAHLSESWTLTQGDADVL